jgi:P4 family phage/plasmid primase-like protien
MNDTLRFFNLITQPGDHREVVIFGAAKRPKGHSIVATAEGFVSESSRPGHGAYVTLNPVSLPASPWCSSGYAKNTDIVERRFLLLDIDANRELSPASSEELAAAKELTDRLKQALTDRGWPEPIHNFSGNGFALIYRVPPDTDAKPLLVALAEEFDTEGAHIDRVVYDKKRLTRVPGTMNRKGDPGADPTGDRIHRMATIVSAPETLEMVPAELLVCKKPDSTKPDSKPENTDTPPQLSYEPYWSLRKWLEKRVTFTTHDIEGGVRYDLDHCIYKGSAHSTGGGPSVFDNGDSIGFKCFSNSCGDVNWNMVLEKCDPQLVAMRGMSAADPQFLACSFARQNEVLDIGGQLAIWRGTRWDLRDDRKLAPRISAHCANVAQWARIHRPTKSGLAFTTTRGRTQDTIAALKGIVESVAGAGWRNGDKRPVIPTPSGLYAMDSGQLLPHTPEYVNYHTLRHDITDAPMPPRWASFLNEALPDASDQMQLQEMMGFVLSPIPELQSILAFQGPTGTGKGVITRVMQDMVGSYAPISIEHLGAQFSLQGAVGKQLLVVNEFDAKTIRSAAVEKLKALAGKDTIDVTVKHGSPLSVSDWGTLLLVTNNSLTFADDAGAFYRRLVPLLLTRKPKKVDPFLNDALKAEMPGILYWSVLGWRRLRERGSFDLSKRSADLHEQLVEQRSPLTMWVNEYCDQEGIVLLDEAYASFRSYVEDIGADVPPKLDFANQLATHGVNKSRPRGNGRKYVLSGISLKRFERRDTIPLEQSN